MVTGGENFQNFTPQKLLQINIYSFDVYFTWWYGIYNDVEAWRNSCGNKFIRETTLLHLYHPK